MHLSTLTLFQSELIRLTDAGSVLSVDETFAALFSDHDVLVWFKRKFPDVDFSVYSGETAEWGDELDDALKRHANAVTREEVGVSRNGLCLLLALLVGIVQSREWEV
jgi:hypothetical protein